MSDLYTIEQAAQRLELRLLSETPSEVKVLYGLAFLRLLRTARNQAAVKAYLLQFARSLADAAHGANPAEFLPNELRDTAELVPWMVERGVPAEYVGAFEALTGRVRERLGSVLSGTTTPSPEGEADAFGLTVEYYTDAGVPPRGRLVGITVEAARQFRRASADDVHVINRLIADDRLLQQAVDAVAAARSLVSQFYRINSRIRHRYDVRLDATLTHLSGNSLGLAFGVAAMCALTKTEPIRTRLHSNPSAAYAGTLESDGQVGSVDTVLLPHKLARAFRSHLKYVVVARGQLQEGVRVVQELEALYPTRRLEVVGVESLSDIVADPRLIRAQHVPLAPYVIRRLMEGKGRYPVLVLLVLMLLTLAWWFVLGRYETLSFTFRPDGIQAFDLFGHRAWYHSEPEGLDTAQYGLARSYPDWLYEDLDHDGRKELVLVTNSPDRGYLGRLLILSCRGRSILDTVVFDQTAVDSLPNGGRFLHFFLTGIIPGTEANPILVLCTRADSPAREYWVFVRPSGEVVGRYHSRGYGSAPFFFDIDDDGMREMVVGVIHNGWDRVSVYAVKPIGAKGFSPPGPKDSASYPIWLTQPPGNQLVYYILPHSRVCKANGLPYPEPWLITEDQGGINVHTCEEKLASQLPYCTADLTWVFSRDLRKFDRLLVTDNYWGVSQKIIPETTDRDSLTQALEGRVLRWSGTSWVPAK